VVGCVQGYHPSRVFTLTYQPLALTTTLIFTCYEARVSTRLRVLLGFGIYIVILLLFIIVSDVYDLH
jgi:equilibrative nucleoside transporter 1/2/3